MNNSPTEEQECIVLADWLRAKNVKFTHIANERKTHPARGKKLKDMGVSPGFPDYQIFITKYQSKVNRPIIIFIEMKRQKGSTTSIVQKQWLEFINEFTDIQSFLCKGATEAINVLQEYIS